MAGAAACSARCGAGCPAGGRGSTTASGLAAIGQDKLLLNCFTWMLLSKTNIYVGIKPHRIDDSDVRAVVDEVLLQLVHPARRPLQRVRVVEGRSALLTKKGISIVVGVSIP